MVQAVPRTLAQIVERKRKGLASLAPSRAALESNARKSRARHATNGRDARAMIQSSHIAIIAEIKRASPSKGLLSEAFDPASIARAYETGGASAISVLTETDFFLGSLADLETARAAVSLPVLRKDFTIDEVHVVEAAAHGADAILLIAAILEVSEMRRFRETAESYHMAALVEVHDADELQSATDSGAEIIGVNNRNLHTFEVNLDTALQLAERIPRSAIMVAESGINSAADVKRLRAAGYQAFLVGEHLMRSVDPARALQELRQPTEPRPSGSGMP